MSDAIVQEIDRVRARRQHLARILVAAHRRALEEAEEQTRDPDPLIRWWAGVRVEFNQKWVAIHEADLEALEATQ